MQSDAPAITDIRQPIKRWLLLIDILGIIILCAALLITDIHRIRTRNTGDFVHFYYAADAMHRGKDPYAAWTRGYIYPPLIAFVFQPLAIIGRDRAAAVMLCVNVTITLLTVALGADEFLRRFIAPRTSLSIASIMLMSMLLNCDKIKGEWQMWQTDVFMLLLFVLALRWLERWPIAAGFALGIAVNIKYLPLMFLPYLLLRRRFKASGALVISTIVFAVLPTISTGWRANLAEWKTATNGLLQMANLSKASTEAAEVHDVRDSLSCSITSAMARSVRHDPMWGFAAASIIAMVTITLAALRYHHHHISLLLRPTDGSSQDQMLTGIEWVMLVAAVLAFGPQTNTRHLYDALIFTIASSVLLIFSKPTVNRWPLVIGTTVMFLGFVLPPGNRTYIGELTPTTVWLRIGGPCWCLLVAAFSLLWTGVESASAEETFNHLF